MINEDYWIKRNPNVLFSNVKKAYFGSYLLRAELEVTGSSIHYYPPSPLPLNWRGNRNKILTYKQFVTFIKKHVLQYSLYKLSKIDSIDNTRFIRVIQQTMPGTSSALFRHRWASEIRIFDALVLYNLYKLSKNKPDDVKLSREGNKLRLYSNDENALIRVMDQLKIEDDSILSISYPDKKRIDTLLAGKEYNNKAKKFKYRISIKQTSDDGIPDLLNWLIGIDNTGEVEVPQHCYDALDGNDGRVRWAWSEIGRSYFYARDENTLLMIKLLAGDRYSNCTELVMPE